MLDTSGSSERRRRGRPRLSANEGTAPVCVKLPEGTYDVAFIIATRKRVSMPELIRRALARLIQDEQQRGI